MNLEREKLPRLRSPRKVEKLTMGLLAGNNNSLFTVKEMDERGRCVFLRASVIRKDSFVVEYDGDFISEDEARIREGFYELNGEGCFILTFSFRGKRMAIDATRKYDSVARLINHSRNPNIRFHPPLVTDMCTGIPRIAAYALRDIHLGEEIVMDYGICDSGIGWLKNRQACFLPEMDLSFEKSDNSTNCSENYQTRLMKSSKKTLDFSNTCSNVNPTTPSLPSSEKISLGNKHTIGEFALGFINLLPGRKKGYFASYQSFGTPEKIMRLDGETEKAKLEFSKSFLQSIQNSSELTTVLKRNTSAKSWKRKTPRLLKNVKKEASQKNTDSTWASSPSVDITVASISVSLNQDSPQSMVPEGYASCQGTLNKENEGEQMKDSPSKNRLSLLKCAVMLRDSINQPGKRVSYPFEANPQVAVIKPYNEDKLISSSANLTTTSAQLIQKAHLSLTCSEQKHTKAMFQHDHSSGDGTVSYVSAGRPTKLSKCQSNTTRRSI